MKKVENKTYDINRLKWKFNYERQELFEALSKVKWYLLSLYSLLDFVY